MFTSYICGWFCVLSDNCGIKSFKFSMKFDLNELIHKLYCVYLFTCLYLLQVNNASIQ